MDRAAFTDLLKTHDAKLRSLAWRLLGDRHWMDDALQEAYLRAYRSRESLRNADEAGTWLYRIVYNACIDELRRKKRRPSPVDTTDASFDRPSGVAGPDDVIASGDVIRRGLSALPDEQRAVLVLVDAEGLDYTAAAEILGVAPGTVASRLSRARHAMRTSIGDAR